MAHDADHDGAVAYPPGTVRPATCSCLPEALAAGLSPLCLDCGCVDGCRDRGNIPACGSSRAFGDSGLFGGSECACLDRRRRSSAAVEPLAP